MQQPQIIMWESVNKHGVVSTEAPKVFSENLSLPCASPNQNLSRDLLDVPCLPGCYMEIKACSPRKHTLKPQGDYHLYKDLTNGKAEKRLAAKSLQGQIQK